MWKIEDADKLLIEKQEAIWAQHEERSVLRGQHPQPLPLSRALSATRMLGPRLRNVVEDRISDDSRGFNTRLKTSGGRAESSSNNSPSQLLKEYVKTAEEEGGMKRLGLSMRAEKLSNDRDVTVAQTYFRMLHGKHKVNPYADLEDSRGFIALRNRMGVIQNQAEAVIRNSAYIDQGNAIEITMRARMIRRQIPAAVLAGIAEENVRTKQYFDASKIGLNLAWKRVKIEIAELKKEGSDTTAVTTNKLPRRGHSVTAIDANNVLLFAGVEGNKFHSTLFKLCFNPIRWEQMETTGSKPCGRAFHAVVFDNEESNLICFGGLGVHQSLNDCFELNVSHRLWEPIFPELGFAPPAPRHGHTLTAVSKGGGAILFGGAGAGFFNDTFVFDVKTGRWTEPKVCGQPPTPRAFHSACSLINGSKVFIFGGLNDCDVLDDLCALDIGPDCLTWTSVRVKGIPPCRRWGHNAMPNGMDSMVLFGGGGDSFCNDLHVYNAFSSSWTEFHGPGEAPVGRWGHGMALMEDAQRLFIFGGCGAGRDNRYLSDAFVCNLVHLMKGPSRSSSAKAAGVAPNKSKEKPGRFLRIKSVRKFSQVI